MLMKWNEIAFIIKEEKGKSRDFYFVKEKMLE